MCIAMAKSEDYDTFQRADTKSRFRLIWSLRTENKSFYPECESTEDGCSKFAQRFNEKVQKIRAELDVARSNIVMREKPVSKNRV